MKTVLKLTSSLFSADGQSSRLAGQFVEKLRATEPGLRLLERDLAADPIPHLDAARFSAFTTPAAERNPAQRAVIEFSDQLIDELRAADVLVLGLPMYNFGVPSQLKAWFDHIARAGVTFKYTAQGSVGLLTGKKAYVFATRGGAYQGTPADTQTAYVRDFLGFLGIAEVEFVYAEKLAVSADTKAAALAEAQRKLETLVAPLALAA